MSNKDARNTLSLIITLVLGILSVACNRSSPSSNQEDKSMFIGVPCAAPCWQNLIIGKSTESEVTKSVQALPFIDQKSVKNHRMSMPGLDPRIYGPGVEITADCIVPPKQCLTIDVVDDTLTNIEIKLNYAIDLTEAIHYLGNPDYINYQMNGAEEVTCEVQLIWESKQLILASESFKGSSIEKNCGLVRDTGKIVSNLVISKVRYLCPDAIEFYLASGSTSSKYSGTIPGK